MQVHTTPVVNNGIYIKRRHGNALSISITMHLHSFSIVLAVGLANAVHNLVRNGGFEAAPCAAPSCEADYSTVGWIGYQPGNLIQIITPSSGIPMTGRRAVELNTQFPYSMGQEIRGFIPGKAYQLSVSSHFLTSLV
jgi:hypothetical protein